MGMAGLFCFQTYDFISFPVKQNSTVLCFTEIKNDLPNQEVNQ